MLELVTLAHSYYLWENIKNIMLDLWLTKGDLVILQRNIEHFAKEVVTINYLV